MRGGPLARVLFEIRHFVDKHPSEFIYVTFQEEREHSLSDFAKRLLQSMVVSILGPKCVTSRDIENWFKIESVTIGQVQENKKNIMLCFNGRIGFIKGFTPISGPKLKLTQLMENEAEIVELPTMGIHNKYGFYLDKWHNTDDPEKLFEDIRKHCTSQKKNLSKMGISQFVLTISSKPGTFLKKMFMNNLPTIGNINRELNKDDRQIVYIDNGIDEKLFNIGSRNSSFTRPDRLVPASRVPRDPPNPIRAYSSFPFDRNRDFKCDARVQSKVLQIPQTKIRTGATEKSLRNGAHVDWARCADFHFGELRN